MPQRVISTKLELDGEQDYSSRISGINNDLKTLNSNLKLVESTFKGQSNTLTALTAKNEALQAVYAKQKEKVQELENALQNAQQRQGAYSSRIDATKAALAAAEAELKKLKNTSGDTSEEQAKLAEKIKKLNESLTAAERGYDASTRSINTWQQKVNTAKVELNTLDRELKDTDKYLDEARRSTDQCATSIDEYGKKTKNAAEHSGRLADIFKGGLMASLASRAVSWLTSKLRELVSGAMSTADELEALSAETHISTTELQKLSYVGDDLGVSLDTQTAALRRLINNMDAAKAGSGTAYEAFRRLNVAYADGNGQLRSSTVVYKEVLAALGQVTNETQRDAIAQDILGKSATELNPLIQAGADELEKLAAQAESTGAVMSEDAVRGLDAAGDALDHFGQSAKAVVGEALYGLIGSTSTASDTIADLIDELDNTSAIVELIRQYRELSVEITSSSLSSSELAQKTAELEQVKKALIEASNGVITAIALENGTFNDQVSTLDGLNQSQRNYLKYKLEAAALENTGAQAQQKAQEAADTYNETYNKLTELMALRAEVEDKIANGQDNIWNQSELKNYNQIIETYRAKLGEAATAMADTSQDAEAGESAIRSLVENGFMTASEAAEDFGLTLEEVNAITGDNAAANDGAQESIDGIIGSIREMNEAYDEARTSAEEALDATVGMWDAMDASAKTSAADIEAALQSQVDWLTTYQSNLDALADRKIEGVDMTALVQSLSDGSEESAAILAGLADASDDEVKKIADSMAQVDALKASTADTMAETSTNFEERLGEMKAALKDTVDDLDKSSEAALAARATMQAYLDELNAKEVAISAAAARIAAAVSAALNGNISVPGVPAHARGTESAEQVFLAGENGPELIVGRAGAKVWTAEQTASILARSRALAQEQAAVGSGGAFGTVQHNVGGEIRVVGVNNRGEFVDSVDLIVSQLRREARL